MRVWCSRLDLEVVHLEVMFRSFEIKYGCQGEACERAGENQGVNRLEDAPRRDRKRSQSGRDEKGKRCGIVCCHQRQRK